MPFNTAIPARGTNPWYDAFVVGFVGGLRTFVNNLETLVNGKADASALAAKADQSALTAGLAGKADASALAAKADQSAVTAALAEKADASATTTALGTKVNASTYTTGMAGKADVAAVNAKVTGLGGVTGVWKGTQAQYDALTPDPAVVYVIAG